MYLTNEHVVPNEGADVWQPPAKGPDTPVGNDRIIGKASPHRKRNEAVDCALIEPVGNRTFQGLVLGIAPDVESRVGILTKKDINATKVFKMGAMTGHKPILLGLVDSIDARIDIDGFSFVNQITVLGVEAGIFADQGDSGSILLKQHKDVPNSYQIVGLVHANTSDKRTAVACHFKKVVTALKFTIS
jgi:hypothetical protein